MRRPQPGGATGVTAPTLRRELALFAGDAWVAAVKDLRIEWRSRSVAGQAVPFALFVLVLFGLALDADRSTLRSATPGLLWMSMLFVSMMAAQSSAGLETVDGAGRSLLLSGMPPSAIFVGKTAAVAVQLLAVELVLIPGGVVFYGADVDSVPLVAAVCAVATVGLAAVGSLIAAVVVGAQTHKTVLPILLMPMASPVLVAAARAFDDALGVAAVNGWAWVGLLGAFAVGNLTIGVLAYPALSEDG